MNAAATTSYIIITWDAVGGATGYDVEVDGIVANNSSSTNYVHKGLIPGTQHSYSVRSINSGGKSGWSNEILMYTLTDTPPVPANLGATAANDHINVTWGAVAGCTYDIKVDGTETDNISSTTYTHSGLTPETQHTYSVRAKKSGSVSDWSSIFTISTLADVFGIPANFKADASDTAVALSWDAVAGSTGYDLEIDGAVIDNGTNITCIHNGLTPGTQHTYMVRAKNGSQLSDWSNLATVSTALLPTPGNLAATGADDSITLTWDAVSGAEGYDIDMDGSTVPDIATTTYTFGGLSSNTQHTFKVKAKNSSGTSAWSTPLVKSTQFNGYSVPVHISAISRDSSVTLLWSTVDNATGYDIEADGNVTADIQGTSYLQSGISSGTQHTYRVRAKQGNVISNWSNLVTVSTLPSIPATPTNVTASSTTTSIMVTWDGVDNVTGYDVEVDGTIMDNGTGTTYLHGSLSPDTQHTYRIRAKNTAGVSGWSNAVTLGTKSSTEQYNVSCTNNEVFNLMFTASDIQNPDAYTFTITYNPQELDVVDLCGTTPRLDMTTGNIIGTDVQVIQFAPGTIVFKKITPVQGSQSWSGEVDSIKFKSKISGQSTITYNIQ